MSTQPTLDTIVSLAKRRGFVFPTSEIYGGLANSYEYGPMGVELLRNIKDLWWKEMIHRRPDMVGLDSQIMLHPKTWVASGHVGSFTDPLVEDLVTHKRYRADHLVEEWLNEHNRPLQVVKNKQITVNQLKNLEEPELTMAQLEFKNVSVEDMTISELASFISNWGILSPEGNPLSAPKTFNLLFETEIGSVAGEKAKVYLRGETAQGIFSNFKHILDSSRLQLPFGVGQIGKSFRNEVTTGQFVFRTLEFEQAEIEYFFNPHETDWRALMNDWKDVMWQFVTKTLGITAENLRWRQHTDKERSHYSLDTYDLDYQFSFGWKELWGIAYRTDYDLKQHIQHSGQKLEYTNPQTGDKIVPHVIEPAVGINRLFLMALTDAYWLDAERQRTVLRLSPKIAPYKVAVFPLVKNKPEIVKTAKELYQTLAGEMTTAWDDRGNIGKRYLSQDEIGTPFCVTVDYQTLEDNTVTIRHRDSAEQERISSDTLVNYVTEHLK